MRHQVRAASLAIAISIVAVACSGGGGGSSNGATTTAASRSTLSKADFIRQADAICADTTSKVNALAAPAGDPTPASVATFAQQTLAIVEPALQSLAALPAAPSDASVLQDNLIGPTKTDDAAAQTFIDAVTAANGDAAAQQAALSAFSSAGDPNSAAHDKALADFGFDGCSKTSSGS